MMLSKPTFYKSSSDICLYIGRFQPVHDQHVANIKTCLRMAQRLIVGICASNLPISSKNPWSVEQRILFLKAALSPEELAAISFVKIPDVAPANKKDKLSIKQADDKWAEQARSIMTDKISALLPHQSVYATFYGVGKDPTTQEGLIDLERAFTNVHSERIRVTFSFGQVRVPRNASEIRQQLIRVDDIKGVLDYQNITTVEGVYPQVLSVMHADHRIRKHLMNLGLGYHYRFDYLNSPEIRNKIPKTLHNDFDLVTQIDAKQHFMQELPHFAVSSRL